jgi:hypothetical protein
MSGCECKPDRAQPSKTRIKFGMTRVQRSARLLVAVSIAVLLLPLAAAATDLGAIRGRVRDSAGTPLVGALVIAVSSVQDAPERMVFTDKSGTFQIPHLLPGSYSIRISMPRFLPVMQQGIQLDSGASATLTINLQNALEVVRRVVSRENQDIEWTLRSSRSTQPVLRLVASQAKETYDTDQTPEYSGYFQVYSKSVETSSGATEGVGSQFSVTMPLAQKSQFTLAGLYSEIPTQPRGFGATYQFAPTDRHRSQIGVKVRQGALFADPLQTDSLKEVQLEYGEQFQWSDHIVFDYGAEAGRADAVSARSYLRPRFGVSWVPEARTTFTVSATSQAPTAVDDPIRGKEYFDRTLYVPPALERYSHVEMALSRVLSENLEVSAAVFRDRTDNQALFVSTGENRHGVVIFDTRNKPSQGFRVQANRRFRGVEAGVGYTTANGAALKMASTDPNELRKQMVQRQFQVVTARFKADVDTTRTEITAIYRWMSGFSASRIDSYQQLFEYNDPTLSLTVAQNLPGWRIFPGKIQAILDARNLFENSFGPRRMQAAQYPRLVKGGINIKF